MCARWGGCFIGRLRRRCGQWRACVPMEWAALYQKVHIGFRVHPALRSAHWSDRLRRAAPELAALRCTSSSPPLPPLRAPVVRRRRLLRRGDTGFGKGEKTGVGPRAASGNCGVA